MDLDISIFHHNKTVTKNGINHEVQPIEYVAYNICINKKFILINKKRSFIELSKRFKKNG